MFETRRLHRNLHLDLLQLGVSFSVDEDVVLPSSDGLFPCFLCHTVCPSRQQLSAHLWSQHQFTSFERKFTFGATCLACHRCFWTHTRLQQHLRMSRLASFNCLAWLVWNYAPARHLHCELCWGPHRREDVETIGSHEEAVASFRRQWDSAGFPAWPNENAIQRLWPRFTACICTWDTRVACESLVFELLSLCAQAQRDDHDLMSFVALSMWFRDCWQPRLVPLWPVDFLEHFWKGMDEDIDGFPFGPLLKWHWRILDVHCMVPAPEAEEVPDPHVHPREPWSCCVLHQARMLSAWTSRPSSLPSDPGVPVHPGNVLWLLHMFSGRRRRADFHDWVTFLGPQVLPGDVCKVVSVDTAVHPVLGNLRDGPSLRHLQALARSGFFCGDVSGPPCETWSAARWLALDGEAGPRPLRTADRPWGLPTSTSRELRQTQVGTELFLNSVSTEVMVALHGGVSVMEHPAEPAEAFKASTWKVDLQAQRLEAMCSYLPNCIEQWLYGADSVKPTCLRTFNCSEGVFASELRPHADHSLLRPRHVLRGRQSDGSFRTAAAKEYSSALSRAICMAVLRSVRDRLYRLGSYSPDTSSLDHLDSEWLHAMHVESEVIHDASTFLPDYQGGA